MADPVRVGSNELEKKTIDEKPILFFDGRELEFLGTTKFTYYYFNVWDDESKAKIRWHAYSDAEVAVCQSDIKIRQSEFEMQVAYYKFKEAENNAK